MVPVKGGTTSDGRFSFLEAGERGAIPVVILHGVGGGASAWVPQLERLGERYHAVAWNMPGYGGSAPDEPMSVGSLGDALGRFLAALGLDRPILVGHSLGGMVVQSYLADELGQVRAAVLVQTSAAFGGKDPGWARSFVAEKLGPLARGDTMASLAPTAVSSIVGADPDPAGLERARSAFAAVPIEAYRASVQALVGFDRREALERIAVPTLLLAGSADTSAPAATMAKMASRIPGAEYICVDGAGHLVAQERPHAFAAALDDFLERHTRDA